MSDVRVDVNENCDMSKEIMKTKENVISSWESKGRRACVTLSFITSSCYD